MKNSLEQTQAIYEAFGKGDIPSILNALADEVHWEEWENNTAQKAGVPWMKGGNGKQVAIDYFNEIGKLGFKDFRMLSIMANDHQTAVEYCIELGIPETGKSYKDEAIHLWTFNDEGKVIRFRHYCDTAKMIEAIRK